MNGSLSAKVLDAPVHSGAGSGIIPDSFRILRILLGRLERAETGEIIPPGLNVEIPEERKKEAAATAQILGDAIYKDFPTVEGLEPVTGNLTQLYLNRSWRPQLTVVGQDGMPPAESAGNVIRPFTTLQLSLRLPPTLKAEEAQQIVRTVLTEAPPYNSEVAFEVDAAADGWNAAPSPPWLADVLAKTSENRFGKPAQVLLEGVSIGVLKMLENKFPEAPFVVTGVLGPHSNAHGPNESLDLSFVKKLTGCVADVLSVFSQ